MEKFCEWCEQPLPAPVSQKGRPRIYCGSLCRQEAYQARKLLKAEVARPMYVREEPRAKPLPPRMPNWEAAIQEVMASPTAIKRVLDLLLARFAFTTALRDEEYQPVIEGVVVLYGMMRRLANRQPDEWLNSRRLRAVARAVESRKRIVNWYAGSLAR